MSGITEIHVNTIKKEHSSLLFVRHQDVLTAVYLLMYRKGVINEDDTCTDGDVKCREG